MHRQLSPSRIIRGEKGREIVVVEFMDDGWRGSEKVLNQEEQINAMLSRPFYQPFNIIGSRARRSDNFGSRPCKVDFVLRREPCPFVCRRDDHRDLYSRVTLRIFILPTTSPSSAFQRRNPKLRAKFCEEWDFSTAIWKPKYMNVLISEFLESLNLFQQLCRIVSKTKNYMNFLLYS